MRILIRTSKWAVWARRFGTLALPLALLAVLLHRERFITSDNFLVVEAVAMGLAALAIACALIAFVRLWITGDQGWGRAFIAFLMGSLCLTPAAYFLWQAVTVTSATDVSTDFSDPPNLVSFVPSRFVGPDERARLEAAYPNARSRTYPIAAAQMYDLVSAMVDARGWEIRTRRVPLTDLDTGQLNVVVTTLLGFRQEVAIRVAGGADGTTVAMRSTSLSAVTDFGENGARIEAFLLELDTQVTDLLRSAPTATATEN